jgi:LacI family transcriptional regulator, galactose operon repressor
MARPTLQDVANRCGVSRATVSAVINGKDWVSEKTRARVLHVLREQGYQGHLIADSLSEHFSKMVGVVVGNIRNPFNTELISSLQDALKDKGYFIVHHGTNESYEGEVQALHALRAYEFAGYVVAPVQEGRPHDHIQEIRDAGKPLVSIGEMPDLETHVVDFDSRRGSKEATDYLIAQGHRDIVCLAGPETSLFARYRIMGFVESLMNHGLPVGEDRTIVAGATFASGYEAARKALRVKSQRPSALLCFNDLVAIGTYRCAYDLGLRIPDDLSIVGFDDVPLAAVMGPPLTTVATYPRELGEAAAEILLGEFSEKTRHGYVRRVTIPKLIERSSVRTL